MSRIPRRELLGVTYRSAGRRSLIVALFVSVLACSHQLLPSSAAATSSLDGSSGPGITTVSAADVADVIRAQLIKGDDQGLGSPTEPERAELTALYQARGDLPLWIDTSGRPNRQARESLSLLHDARSEGLDPADYWQDAIEHQASTLTSISEPLPGDLASFDVAVSRAMLRYFRHLHLGRIDPRELGLRLKVRAEDHDFADLLRSAQAGDRIVETVADLRPRLAQYQDLRAMLARYRALATNSSSESSAMAVSAVRPGQVYAGVDVLFRELATLGDLPETSTLSRSERYEGALVEGVRRFQVRHGLEPNGILNKETQAALRVPLTWRVRQIELALERMRWLPDLNDDRLVAINIPMFRLWAWDSTPPDGEASLVLDVIVGRALSTQTPVFVEEMREVIFRPYWNIPPSILRNETLPHLSRDPDYLRRENMEIVRGDGDNAQPVDATAENVALLRKGVLRVRQRPGPHNALGLVKFVFPNQENVYMHGTPAQALFSRSRRDFSHGCVRVEDPVALAEWVLKEQPEWTRDRILAAMQGTRSVRVSVPRPVQVILFYTTAAVMPEDGTIHFADDIYRHDARLDRALARANASE
jgi:L,D-transpeptidase YcbB